MVPSGAQIFFISHRLGVAMTGERQRYRSYLLRLWQTRDGEDQVWRASLETPGTGERRGFASLEDLVDFLQAQTRDQKNGTISPETGTGGEEFCIGQSE